MTPPGCVVNTSLLALPTTSFKRPKLETASVTPGKVAVPVLVIDPEANGVPAVGRTRTFCQVIVLGVLPVLLVVMVNVSWVEETDVMASDVQLTGGLLFLVLSVVLPVILTVGAVPPVSKTNPLGALRITVPAAAFPVATSV